MTRTRKFHWKIATGALGCAIHLLAKGKYWMRTSTWISWWSPNFWKASQTLHDSTRTVVALASEWPEWCSKLSQLDGTKLKSCFNTNKWRFVYLCLISAISIYPHIAVLHTDLWIHLQDQWMWGVFDVVVTGIGSWFWSNSAAIGWCFRWLMICIIKHKRVRKYTRNPYTQMKKYVQCFWITFELMGFSHAEILDICICWPPVSLERRRWESTESRLAGALLESFAGEQRGKRLGPNKAYRTTKPCLIVWVVLSVEQMRITIFPYEMQ